MILSEIVAFIFLWIVVTTFIAFTFFTNEINGYKWCTTALFVEIVTVIIAFYAKYHSYTVI